MLSSITNSKKHHPNYVYSSVRNVDCALYNETEEDSLPVCSTTSSNCLLLLLLWACVVFGLILLLLSFLMFPSTLSFSSKRNSTFLDSSLWKLPVFSVSDYSSNNVYSSVRRAQESFQDGKYIPDKHYGDDDEIFSNKWESVSTASPVLTSNASDGADNMVMNSTFFGSDNTSSVVSMPVESKRDYGALVYNNLISMTVYAALQPQLKSQGFTLSDLITTYFNQTKETDVEYNLTFFVRQQQRLNSTINETATLKDAGGNPNDSVTDTTNRQIQADVQDHSSWNVLNLGQDPKLYMAENDVWWWEYKILYACVWPKTDRPITNDTLMDSIAITLFDILKMDSESGSLQDWALSNYYINHNVPSSQHILDMVTDPSLISSRSPLNNTNPDAIDHNESKKTNPSENVTDDDVEQNDDVSNDDFSPNSNSINPATNMYQWNWQRYVGLGVFVATFLSSAILMSSAAYHQRRLRDQELWGNLATREGVDELLKMGWKVDGSTLEVYDKSKLGYDDNDSMLIGGYEQKPIIVATTDSITISGEEVTIVTHTESELTPELHTNVTCPHE